MGCTSSISKMVLYFTAIMIHSWREWISYIYFKKYTHTPPKLWSYMIHSLWMIFINQSINKRNGYHTFWNSEIHFTQWKSKIRMDHWISNNASNEIGNDFAQSIRDLTDEDPTLIGHELYSSMDRSVQPNVFDCSIDRTSLTDSWNYQMRHATRRHAITELKRTKIFNSRNVQKPLFANWRVSRTYLMTCFTHVLIV